MAARVRLSDIAEEAGVSITTVGRVLSGGAANVRVSRERAEAIRAIADKLQYRPNISARTLAGQASRVIGVLIDSYAPGLRFRIVAGIEREAGKNGYRVMIGEMHDSVESLRDNYQVFCQHGVDGVIILSHEYASENLTLADCLQASSRIVFVDPPQLKDASFVRVDRESGVAQTVCELAARGRKRIGLLTDQVELHSIRQRIDGYGQGLRACGQALPFLLHRVPILSEAEQIRLVAAQAVRDFVIAQRIDALIAPNDLYAVALLSELQSAGLSVPDDVALVGHDNEAFCGCLTPALSSVDEANELTAIQAVRMLLEGIRDADDHYIARQVCVKTKLIVRDSIGTAKTKNQQ